ncbi:MAG: hypothetical protein H7831_16360 [Magnetococcus sp. WYHC-3]
MSDNLRGKIRKEVNEIADQCYGDTTIDDTTDAILALIERSAVERERKAFVVGFEYCEAVGRDISSKKLNAEYTRRYPLPKEE